LLNLVCVISGVLLILTVLWEAFETIVLPRRVTRQFRLTRAFYRTTWAVWRCLAAARRDTKKRDALLSYFGPMSLLLLFAFWAVALVFGFALVHYGDGAPFNGAPLPGHFGNSLYLSGTTLFTLGLGDITPSSPLGRLVTVMEAGIGFGFGSAPMTYAIHGRSEPMTASALAWLGRSLRTSSNIRALRP